MEIRERREEDLPAVRALLAAAGLPADGLERTRGWVAAEEGEIHGHVASQGGGECVLLRSLAVDAARRGKGTARRLMAAVEREWAEATAYLRTRTIEGWMERLGYERIGLEETPEMLRGMEEFSGSICTSVPVFRKTLTAAGGGAERYIFACVHNAGRSQMAAAFFNRLADPDKARAVSAGTEPAGAVHPVVVEAMREAGIDLTEARPQRLTGELADGARMLITMGCGEQCPMVPGLERADWQLEDPKGKPMETVRAIREEIRRRVGELIAVRRLG